MSQEPYKSDKDSQKKKKSPRTKKHQKQKKKIKPGNSRFKKKVCIKEFVKLNSLGSYGRDENAELLFQGLDEREKNPNAPPELGIKLSISANLGVLKFLATLYEEEIGRLIKKHLLNSASLFEASLPKRHGRQKALQYIAHEIRYQANCVYARILQMEKDQNSKDMEELNELYEEAKKKCNDEKWDSGKYRSFQKKHAYLTAYIIEDTFSDYYFSPSDPKKIKPPTANPGSFFDTYVYRSKDKPMFKRVNISSPDPEDLWMGKQNVYLAIDTLKLIYQDIQNRS